MGFLDQLQSLAGNALQGEGQNTAQQPSGQTGSEAEGQPNFEQQSSISKALISSVADHPGGIGGLLDSFRQNGMGSHVDSWVNSEPGQGTPQQLNPQQVQQGLPASIFGSIAQRTGLSPQMISMGLTTILPLVMQHLTPNGQVPQQSQLGGLAGGLLSKLL